jgi:predicted HicB family RNase H-like nuclease
MPKVNVSDSVQLATRIPKRLHRELKLDCVAAGVTLETWIRDALTTHLARVTGKPSTGARGAHGT